MSKAQSTISNKLGLHARASAKLTKLAASFPCDIWLTRGERRVNAKSIMGVMCWPPGWAPRWSSKPWVSVRMKP